MRSLLRPLALVALAPALFAQDASNRIPADLAALIPSDASSLIYLAPIDEIEESIQEMLAIVAPDMEMMADADMLLSELSPPGFNIDLIDRSRPIAVAIGAITVETQQSGPRFFVLIPTTDAAGLLAALPTGEPFSSRITGGYPGLSNADRYPVGGKASALPGVLPAGMLAMTLDAEPILDAFAPIAEFMMGMGKNGLLQEMRSDSEVPPALLALAEGALDGSLSFVTDALDSISSFDLGFGIQGAEVDLGYGLNFREGSPLTKLTNTAGPRFRDMLKLVDTNAAGSSVVGFDLGSLARWARPYVDQILDSIPVPDEMEPGESLGPFQSPRHAFEAVRGAINASIDTLAWFGDGVATSAYFSGNEMRTASWMHGVQADQLADSLEALFQVELASLVGLNIERSRIGDSVINLSMTFDLDTLGRNFQLGEEELSEMRRELKGVVDMEVNLSLTTVGAQTLMLYNGGRNDIALALKSVKANPGLASSELRLLADKVGDAYPFAVYRFNLGPFAAGMIRMAEGMGESTGVPAGVPETLDGISIPMSIFEG
ncbi:MAG: hypothetical protein H8D72_02210, partial [Planctomycetes bacterium]|nr:hypothetical protein [Planctomycetota bacterium]